MEYPPDTLPAVPPGGVTCGIGWANDDHAVCVAGMAGKVVQRFIAQHTGDGLAGLVRRSRWQASDLRMPSPPAARSASAKVAARSGGASRPAAAISAVTWPGEYR